jgi:hypothetical protein
MGSDIGNDDENSDDDGSVTSDPDVDTNPKKTFPKITEIERFFIEGDSFRKLLVNLQIFLLPTHMSWLTRILMAVPNEHIRFSDRNDNSILNKFKVWIEDLTEENWHWWPLRPKMRMLLETETRIHWRCVSHGPRKLTARKLTSFKHCGTYLWIEIPKPHAETYKALLTRRVYNPNQGPDFCIPRTRRTLGDAWKAWINQTAGSSALPNSRTQVQGESATQHSLSSSEGGKHLPGRGKTPMGSSSSPIPGPKTTQNISIPMGSISQLFVFFCVKGSRRTLELAQINVGQQVDDKVFFEEIRNQYRKKRGFLRYWLSIWQLKDC